MINCLRGVFLCFPSRTQVYATAIANVCNPTCKRLRPRSHAFIFITIYLLKSRNGCSKEHILMSALRQIWAKKSRLEPLLEGYEWEKAILNDGFFAQNGPNVQWFPLDSEIRLNISEYHIARLYTHLATICHLGSRVILCVIVLYGSLIATICPDTFLPSCGAR